MKHLLVVLSALLFLSGCTGSDTPVADREGTEDLVVTEPDAESGDETTDEEPAEDAAEDETDAEEDEAEDDAEEDDTAGLEQKNVKLVVNNQETAGQIIVDTVATSRDGWVSVHKSKEDGSIQQPDSIGEARVDSGDSEEIVVDLWEAPDVGDKLWVLLHIDAGERGTYEYPGKDAPVKKNGETMARSFVIQGEEDDEEDEESEE